MPRGGFRKGAGRKRTRPLKPAPQQAAAAAPVQPEAPSQPVVTPIENPHGLSPKELLFVECYTGVSRFNASDAYLRAGFKGKPGKVSGLAARLIARDRVAAAVAKRLGTRLRTLQMDGDEALEGISRIGRADIRKVLDAEGNIRPIDSLDDETADAIQSIKVVERRVPAPGGKGTEVEYTKEFRFYDKLRARELMAKAAGKLVERHGMVGGKNELLKPRRVIVELDDAQPGTGV